MTPSQLRAARALLGWSQDELAARSEVAKRTIAAFEVGGRAPYPRTLGAIRSALEAAGVEFIEADNGGPGVRLRKS